MISLAMSAHAAHTHTHTHACDQWSVTIKVRNERRNRIDTKRTTLE